MSKDEAQIIIQARMSSERFPGKMMAEVNGMPLLKYVYTRCCLSKVSGVCVATSQDDSDNAIETYCLKEKIPVFRGKLKNVLERYIQTAHFLGVKYIVRVCGDTPFVDVQLIDQMVSTITIQKLDYVSVRRTDCCSAFFSEVVCLSALENALRASSSPEDREHVTKYILDHQDDFKLGFLAVSLNPSFMKDWRLVVDYPEDRKSVNKIISRLPNKFNFQSKEILDLCAESQATK